MANRVNLDAMIPREDFAIEEGLNATDDPIKEFPITYLEPNAPILKLLRKPDFQRETNHWSPEQIASFISSFLDNEVVLSLIFWDSPTYIFFLDGGHRLSALRAWMEDDYGDKALSASFYKGQKLSEQQLRMAKRTRALVEQKVGRYSDLCKLVDSTDSEIKSKGAKVLFKRKLILQWVHGSPDVAESSFYKVNSQGTALDETERMLIDNRKKPIAIAARLILRGGSGHKYWSAFASEAAKARSVELGEELHDLLFEPESQEPLRTVDVPLGGSVSPLDALSLLVELLVLAGSREAKPKSIWEYELDLTGEATMRVLQASLEVIKRITGHQSGSLGLHTAIYFYNEQAKHSRFLFLGMVSLIAEKLRNNDSGFFKKFTRVRAAVEQFLVENKSLIGFTLQNLSKKQRVPRMRDMFEHLIAEATAGQVLSVESLVSHLGLQGRVIDVRTVQQSPKVTDETKATLLVRTSIENAPRCPICNARIEIHKSVSYHHVQELRNGGTGDIDNVRLAHPYCNNSRDALQS